MRKIGQKKMQRFMKACHDFLKELGARPDPDGWHDYKLDTIFGICRFKITDGEFCYTLYGKFDEPERIGPPLSPFDFNPYSGKWNFHITHSDVEVVIDEIRSSIARIVADPVWNDNTIQYPRLIAELEAAGAFTTEVLSDLCTSMDLDPDKILDIVHRADTDWESIKESVK